MFCLEPAIPVVNVFRFSVFIIYEVDEVILDYNGRAETVRIKFIWIATICTILKLSPKPYLDFAPHTPSNSR